MLKKEVKSLFFVFIISITLISPLFNNEKFRCENKNTPTSAESWDLSGGYIYIDGSNPSRTWAYVATNYPWCFGSGTENDPYVIENVTIHGSGTEKLLRIERADDYFIIRNCEFSNGEYGIYLEYNVANGKIINNNCSNNLYSGIYSYSSLGNFSILNNTVGYNSDGIILFYAGNYNLVSGNQIFNNNDEGLALIYSSYSQISNNYLYGNMDRGIRLDDAINCNVTKNFINNNGDEGILLYSETKYNTISENFIANSSNGIDIDGASYNQISQNIIKYNGNGVYAEGFNNIINNNTISENSQGIHLYDGSNALTNNSISHNLGAGINIECSNNNVSGNVIKFNNDGIYIHEKYSTYKYFNIMVKDNVIERNYRYGINIKKFNDIYISFNIFNHNVIAGLHTDYTPGGGCWRLLIYNNTFFNRGTGFGIIAYTCYESNISSNLFNGNSAGIWFDKCSNIKISGNQVQNNSIGIKFYTECHNNFLENNTISDNNDIGIYLDFFNNNNNFTHNTIEDNYNFGVLIEAFNANNMLSSNYFSANSINANDSGSNYWNTSLIGNFWDDNLVNTDLNDDGIGDNPYVIWPSPLIQDFLPIFDDGDDPTPPIISIDNPIENQITGKLGPIFQISIAGLHVHTTWYEISGISINITFTEKDGQIDQSFWDELGNGTVTIRFYVNDTLGYGTMDEITIRKDIYNPELLVNSPSDDTLFDINPPNFNIEISDSNLDQSWYTINGGLTNFTIYGNSTINQSAWEAVPDGQVFITFYVNDTAGNLVYNTIFINKDTNSPIININSPNLNDLFGKPTFSFNIEIFDFNLEKMWYTIQGAPINITFTVNGTISSVMWENFGSGQLSLIFYANDTHGRITSESVLITKDIDEPIISITRPIEQQPFYTTAPTYEITVNDPHLELVWYTIDGGITNTTITEYSGSISQSEWTSAPIGDLTITFYARDTLGNIESSDVVVVKRSVSIPPPDDNFGLIIAISMGGVAVVAVSVILIIKFKRK